jgi:hypothetical protein
VHSNGPPSSPLQSESIAHESLGIQFYTCYPLYMPHKKKLTTRSLSISVQLIERRIYLIRGQKVMIDFDLAEVYGVPTKRLNERVARNKNRC